MYFLIYKGEAKSLLLVFSSPEREERGKRLRLINMVGPAGRLIFLLLRKILKFSNCPSLLLLGGIKRGLRGRESIAFKSRGIPGRDNCTS